jgi:signal transduction histidine kinase
MDNQEIGQLIIYFVLTLLILVIILFSLFYIFNSRRLKYIIEKKQAQEKFTRELESSRIENQEHLLKTLSWELHDNIGQLLSVSNMQLSMLSGNFSDKDGKIIADTKELISKILEDVRMLSKSLNAESIVFLGLLKAIHLEVERLNRLGFVQSEMIVQNGIPAIPNEHEIILFRILQECISNVIKHAKATKYMISILQNGENIIITSEDNGVGMKPDPAHFGLGIKNIMSRSAMLGADVKFESVGGGGLKTIIRYPIQTN